MSKFYSKATGGFYPSELRADYEAAETWPADAIEITAAEESALRIPPAPTLAELQSRALSTLPDWEQTERAAGINHAGRRWLTTPAALQDFRDVLLAGMVPGDTWIDAERQPVPMVLTDLQALWAAIVTTGAAIYKRRLQMEAEIAAMDAEQLAVFEPGWPA